MNLYGHGEWWQEYWRKMPEFDQHDLTPAHSIEVGFVSEKDLEEFEAKLGQRIPNYTKRTTSVWHPEAEIGRFADKRYVNRSRPELRNPRHPVYIISKGRWESRHTAKSLEALGVPYRIIVEPAERARYAEVIAEEKILVLPRNDVGHVFARNFAWEHAIASGASWHWCLDDNIDGFYRLNRNLKTPVADGTIFRVAEDFADRYENVAMSGFHYFMFASRKSKVPPLTLNTRVYSCFLIRNDIPYRFRGSFNDDTDFALRILKDGWCSILFSAFLAFKMTTMTVKGGLTSSLYTEDDARLKGSQALVKMHPEHAKVVWKWGRWHHHVDYSVFRKNKLRLKPGVAEIPADVDNYGMELQIDP